MRILRIEQVTTRFGTEVADRLPSQGERFTRHLRWVNERIDEINDRDPDVFVANVEHVTDVSQDGFGAAPTITYTTLLTVSVTT